jgi:hypothetical protein
VRDERISTEAAAGILDEFARDTALEGSAGTPRRYLWTDAFAVCTCLSLHARTGEDRWLERALRLVDQVHHVLGRHRSDGAVAGWLSGLPEDEGEQRPTAGGLRIGKALPERDPDEPYDPDLEWDRDGQYFHYLTKWMHALNRVAVATGESRYHRWAAELGSVAHARFTHGPPAARRLVWKMSVDLSRVLVPATGHHDPLDGLITALTLQSSPARDPRSPGLELEIAELELLCEGESWATHDELGIGGLLTDALRLAELVVAGRVEHAELLARVCEDAAISLGALRRRSPLGRPLEMRLPFRELGLAVGLHAVERLRDLAARGALPSSIAGLVAQLERDVPMAAALEQAWLDPAARRVPTWTEHRDINAVTLAASLAPEGYLGA